MKKILFTSFIYLLLALQPSQATDKSWVCGSDSWDNSACWDTAGQPSDSDTALLSQNDAVDRTITYSSTIYPVLELNSLMINATGSGTMTLSQSQDSLAAATEYIGYDGTGTFTHSGGDNIVNDLYLGYLKTGNGTYNLSGTGNLLADREVISRQGSGTFNQTGGTNESNYIAIASAAGSDSSGTTGTYNLSGGSLSVTNMDIASSGYPGSNATGVFNQSGGSVTVSNRLNLADLRGASGTYNLSDGSLEAGELGLWDVDQTGITGVFNQTGGTVTTDRIVSTFDGFTYNLDGGSLTTKTIDLQAWGHFNQTGGVNTVSDTLTLDVWRSAGQPDSGSHYTLTNGALNAENIVIKGGTFTQTGGTNEANYIAVSKCDEFECGSGTYNLSAGTLSVTNMDIASTGYPGSYATGVFNQSGGSVTVSNRLNLADLRGASGTYNLSDGSLEAGELGLWDMDQTGITGVFNQTGGTVTTNRVVSTFDSFTYNLDGGSLTTDTIDLQAWGRFNQTGGVNTVSDTLTLDIWRSAGISDSGSHYTLTDGTLNAGSIVVRGSSTFNFNGGRLAVNNFTGNLINNGGTLAPGNSPGTTQINGNYTQADNGVFEVEIGGYQQGSEYDWLNITGKASLDGELNVDLFGLGSGPLTLGEGDVFDILSAETITGEFDLLTLTVLDEGLEWDISYLTDVTGTTDLVRLTVNQVNLLPIANAGNDQVVNESDAVNLNGNSSSDSDGSIDSYDWTQIAGTPVALSGATSATPSFAAPVGASDTTLTFSLVVTDNDGSNSIADTVDIVVANVNGLPTAFAGVDQIANEGIRVDLDGQGSSDSDGDIAAYNWVQTAGTSVNITNADTVRPSFTAPSVISDAVLMFSLEVTDADGDSDTDSVAITITNALVVDAGADQQVTEEELVQLNGLNSSLNSSLNSLFVNGNVNAYQWIQIEGPAVNLDDSSSAAPSFTAPSVNDTTLLVFKLTVTDSNGSQDIDTTFVNVRDVQVTDRVQPLDAQLVDNTVESGGVLYQFDTVTSPFAASTEIQWKQISGPAVTLIAANTAKPSFLTPTVSANSVTTFEVRSEDVNGLIVRARVNINILAPGSVNQSPTANAGKNRKVTEGDTVQLNATASTDSDSNIVSYYWQQTGGPVVSLSSVMKAQPSFVAPAITAAIASGDDDTELFFELVVTDDGGFVDSQTVTITVSDNGITNFADDVTAIISSSGDPIGIQVINNGSLVALEAVNPGAIIDDVNRPDDLPYGLLDFSLRVEPGATVQVSFALPSPADANLTWWKYSSDSGWLDYSANTSFNAARDVMTITLTDGDFGDEDPTAGVIRDPGGLALASAPAAGGSSSSGSGGGGSTGPLLYVLLLLGFFARAFVRGHNRRPVS